MHLVCEKITAMTSQQTVAMVMMEFLSDVTAVSKFPVAIKGSEFTTTCFRVGDGACST
jgi:hypothetical protein